MKMFKSLNTLILLSIVLVLAFAVPLKAQDQPQDYVDEHNRARAQVQVPPMKWDQTLAKYAWNYAQQRKRDCSLIPSNSGVYGENLAWHSSSMSGTDAVRLWVSKKSSYAQVVWRASVWLGCAKVRCDNGGTFVICNYYPPAN
ncbi:hypothetical protein CARUB_v10021758mg [Capsella rubella]|uniref:SCP domain-containing protein n=1 Tax=Capsella rubella TaxID=81985 RepID=R0GEK9_9BRAS|nr:pathogenesis-related protein 1 [Capsella rubella]EOA34247.1 hypothetical protein CARUB_v10021758mg [Capsella rubella]